MSIAVPLPLIPKVKYSTWGCRPESSSIFRLLDATNLLEKDTGTGSVERLFAELWLGAHPSAPSDLLLGERRVTWDEFLNGELASAYGLSHSSSLAFLLKILNVKKPLSIQAHPDLKRAAELHRKDPEHYPDSNHKPEAGIAISSVKLLYGFRPIAEIVDEISRTPELLQIIGTEGVSKLVAGRSPEVLRDAYSKVMRTDDKQVSAVCSALYSRLNGRSELNERERLAVDLATIYPTGDVGVFSIFLFNLVELNPGEVIFIDANVPHAYLEGDLFEVMANSDNVVRGGLTDKFKDVETLVSMLRYDLGFPQLLSPQSSENGKKSYVLPIGGLHFEVMQQGKHRCINSVGPSLLLGSDTHGTISNGEETLQLSPLSSYILPVQNSALEIDLKAGTLLRAWADPS